jgi:Ca2+-transporting ATPase
LREPSEAEPASQSPRPSERSTLSERSALSQCSTLPIEELLHRLGSSGEGLEIREAGRRLAEYGRNELEKTAGEHWVRKLLAQFNSPVIWILLGAVLVSLVIGEAVDALVIGIILILNAALGFFQEARAEKAIEALQKMASLKAAVLRDGEEIEIDAARVVPGDIVMLDTGDKIPADSRIIEEFELETQESALTGESTPVVKESEPPPRAAGRTPIADMRNMVFSGTVVTRGRAKTLVCATGMRTEIGRIADMIQSAGVEQTPLQAQLTGLGKWLGLVTLLVCGVVFLTGIFLYDMDIVEIFFTAVALAVAAIPEGLPAVVTISLSLGVRRMVARNALVRRLPSVETLGCTTVICTDKTGTLTLNEMTVRHLFVNGSDVRVEGSGYRPEGGFSEETPKLDLLLRIGALNNDARIDRDTWSVAGDPTEGCLIVSALKAGIDKVEAEKQWPRIDEIPFDSERKLMTTVHEVEGKHVAYVKGAPDLLLERCDRLWTDGKVSQLSKAEKDAITAKNEEYAGGALRVLGFAYKEIGQGEPRETYEEDLIFVGLQAMRDPPRSEVRDAIARCREAGIRVIMITGDMKTTSEAIGRELGIEGVSITGAEIHDVTDDALRDLVREVAIFARVNPDHKLRIVEALKDQGHVVAMTGDGVNDAPALKKADIGIAMGITGTDVAKEASEMILTDDNFASIVNAVEEGRGIYDNIRKFVNYLLSGNVGEVLTIFVAALLGLPLPLLAAQLLWINLITDGFPAVALGVDPVAKDAMKHPPRRKTERIMSRNMSIHVFAMGALICLATLLVYRVGLRESVEVGRTMAFMTLVLLEIVRLQMVRSPYRLGLFTNRWLLGAIIVSLIFQLLIVYTPLGRFFGTVPPQGIHWLYMGAALAAVLIAGTLTGRLIERLSPEPKVVSG